MNRQGICRITRKDSEETLIAIFPETKNKLYLFPVTTKVELKTGELLQKYMDTD